MGKKTKTAVTEQSSDDLLKIEIIFDFLTGQLSVESDSTNFVELLGILRLAEQQIIQATSVGEVSQELPKEYKTFLGGKGGQA